MQFGSPGQSSNQASTAVTEALEEYVRRRQQLEVLDLFGTIDYDSGYDCKASPDACLGRNHGLGCGDPHSSVNVRSTSSTPRRLQGPSPGSTVDRSLAGPPNLQEIFHVWRQERRHLPVHRLPRRDFTMGLSVQSLPHWRSCRMANSCIRSSDVICARRRYSASFSSSNEW